MASHEGQSAPCFTLATRRESLDRDRLERLRRLRELFVPFRPLSGVGGGVHYFVVCIVDDRQTVNIIPHKYLVEPNGKIGRDNFYGWNREEREDYNRLMLAGEFKPGDEARLQAIRAKGENAMDPPRESLYALAALSQLALRNSDFGAVERRKGESDQQRVFRNRL